MRAFERRPTRGAARLLALAVLVPSCLASRAALAQPSHETRPMPPPVGMACLDSIPASALTQVPVYLEAQPLDSTARALTPPADLLASVVAERLREMLGAPPGQPSPGSPAIGWLDVGSGVRVTMHRDGRFTWAGQAPDSAVASVGAGRGALTDSIVRALASLDEAGERMFWPEGVEADSSRFRLALIHPTVHRDGRIGELRARLALPVTSVAVPWETPVVALHQEPPRYPSSTQRSGVGGTVIMRWIVNARGEVDMGTVRDVWPDDRPRLKGEMGRHYDFLVQAVRRSLARSRFEPARVGGCAVPQLMQQPFVFDLR